MDTMTIKRKKFLPFLQSKKNRILFMVINIYLIIGVGSLLITMFYLIGVSRNYKCTENGKLECTENGNNSARLLSFQM